MKYDTTLPEFMSMIQQKEFAYKPVKWVRAKHLEKVNLSSSFTLFDALYTKYGRIPTHQEYISEGLAAAKFEIEHDPKYYWITWDSQTEGYFQGRLCRSYPSHVVEYHAILTLKHYWGKKLWIGTSSQLDGVLGVDFVIVSKKSNKAVYAHVLKDTPKSFYYLNKKGSKYKFPVNGKTVYFQRDFNHNSSHVKLPWTWYESESTKIVNGLPLFKELWLGRTLSRAMQESKEVINGSDSQYLKLHSTLKEYGIKMEYPWVS